MGGWHHVLLPYRCSTILGYITIVRWRRYKVALQLVPVCTKVLQLGYFNEYNPSFDWWDYKVSLNVSFVSHVVTRELNSICDIGTAGLSDTCR